MTFAPMVPPLDAGQSLPGVSILCLTYNHEPFIREALEGLLAQDYPNLQVVIADDGSTDGTTGIVQEYAPRFGGRLELVTGPNLGITGNCNRALAACTGKYVALTAGDDILLPGKVARQVAWLEADDRRVLCGHDVEVFESRTGRRLFLWSEHFPTRGGTGAREAVLHVPYCATAIMLRRSAFPAYGFDPRVAILSDWKLVIDCLAAGGAWGHVDGILARYRRHGGNVTNTTDTTHLQRMFAEVLTVLALTDAQYPELLAASRRARAFYLVAHARSLWDRRQRAHTRRYVREALRADPLGVTRRLAAYVLRVATGRTRPSVS